MVSLRLLFDVLWFMGVFWRLAYRFGSQSNFRDSIAKLS